MKSKSIMNDLRQRLAQCFSVVFPDLKMPEVYSASSSSVAAWDSMAAIILANVIEEEFRVKLDYDVLPELVSFDLMANYLESDHLKNNHGIS
jgi:acyl carrier protein